MNSDLPDSGCPMPRRIFVVGATGTIGGTFLQHLLRDRPGLDVTCLCRSERAAARLSALPVRTVNGELNDRDSLVAAYDGQPCIVSAAPILYTANLLSACGGIDRLIAVSTTGVFSAHRGQAPAIREAESLIETSGVGYTIMRPTLTYGCREDGTISRLIRFIKRCPVIPLPGGGNSLFQPVHVDDVASALVGALVSSSSERMCYNIAGGSTHSLSEIVHIIASQLERSVITVSVPLGAAERVSAILGRLTGYRGIDVGQLRRLREDKTFGYEDATRDVDYRPRGFAEGVGEQIRSGEF